MNRGLGFEERLLGDTAVLVPVPSFKPITTFFTEPSTTRWEVSESVERVQAAVKAAETTDVEWYRFTDPVYHFGMFIRRSTLRSVSAVIEDMKDMRAVNERMAQADYGQIQERRDSANTGVLP